MLVHDLKLIHGESRAGRELHDVLRRRHLPARKYLLSDEPHEPQITHSDRDTVLGPIARRMREYRLQYHAAIVGQDSVGGVEERRVPRLTERLESFNAEYAVDGLIELLPPSQEYPARAVGVDLLQKSLAVGARCTDIIDENRIVFGAHWPKRSSPLGTTPTAAARRSPRRTSASASHAQAARRRTTRRRSPRAVLPAHASSRP